MEQVNCDLCGKDDTKLLFTARDLLYKIPGEFKVVKCKNCGLVYINPRPTKAEISKYYPKQYEPHILPDERKKWSTWRADIFLALALQQKKGKILDIGCGWGGFLDIMKSSGWEVYGIDTNADVIEYANKKLGLNVFRGTLENAKFSECYFDAITMIHSLEHMYSPAKTIQKCHNLLKFGGVLLIETPNIASIESRIFKERWFALQPPTHLYHFSPETLSAILTKTNFTVECIEFDHGPDGLRNTITLVVRKKTLDFMERYLLALLRRISLIEAKLGRGWIMVIKSRKI